MERFDKGVIAYDQLEIAETIGEGDNNVCIKNDELFQLCIYIYQLYTLTISII